MKRALKLFIAIWVLISLLLAGAWVSLTSWLPVVAKHYLPEGVTLSLSKPIYRNKHLEIEKIELNVGQCQWISVDQTQLNLAPWAIAINQVNSQNECMALLPKTETASAPQDIKALLANLPAIDLTIADLQFSAWQEYRGALALSVTPERQTLISYQGDKAQLEADINPAGLVTVKQAMLQLAEQKITLNGQIALPTDTASIPATGEITSLLTLNEPKKNIKLRVQWQDQQGIITVNDLTDDQFTLNLPWKLDKENIQIQQGEWSWKDKQIPLQGGVNFNVENWQSSLSEMRFSGRLNMITQARKGKGNLVLTVQSGQLDLIASKVDFSLNGLLKYDDMVLDVNLPASLTGPLLSPRVAFQPGALLRSYGRISPTMKLIEARWPLAGTSVDADGISGRLQAIVKLQERFWGNFDLHLDGQAKKFGFDHGDWQWRYWGNAKLPALKADWDLNGKGYWQDTLLVLTSLNTGFNQIEYGLLSMTKPRLLLVKPLKWQRDATIADLQGGFELTTQRMQFGDSSHLPATKISSELSGKSPENFAIKGELTSKNVGPIPYYARWDGSRLRGSARWPKQPITAFQTLIPPDLGFTLREGDFIAQAAFSITAEQGFKGGGHWRVDNAGMWMKDGEVSGVNFSLPWRLENSVWQLGIDSPVELRIKQVNNLFELNDIKADLRGYYPPTDKNPIELKDVSLALLNGRVSLSLLRWPQKQPAIIKIEDVELDQLFSILKVSQFGLSGKIEGELPFYLDNPDWIVRNGYVRNKGPLIARLDPEFVTSIEQDNFAAGMAMSWLSYLEVSESSTEVALTNLGVLTMKTVVQGFNPLKNKKREVRLTYQHEENVFQLWRSLRFGANLEEWLEKNL